MPDPLPPRQRALAIVERVDKALAAAEGVVGSLRADLDELEGLLNPKTESEPEPEPDPKETNEDGTDEADGEPEPEQPVLEGA